MVKKSAPILFVDHAPALGGAEHSLLLLLKHLDRERFAPHLACTDGPLAKQASALGIAVHSITLARLRRSARFMADWLAGARQIAGVARQVDTAVLVANTVRAASYVMLAARLASVPYVWHMREFWLSENSPRYLWPDRLAKLLLCAAAVRVITNSQATASHLPCPGKITVVYNGIETDRFDPSLDGAAFRRQHNIPPQALLVGTLGRLLPLKGQDRFLRVMAQVAQAIPTAWFTVVGGDIFNAQDRYTDYLHRLAADLGLAQRAIFTGQISDPGPSLAAMDLFVQPGEPEAFGLVNIEAMAMCKPVVAFAHGALPEIVVNGETGFLVSPGDEDALAAAVVTLLREPSRQVAMGQAGRERVMRKFTVEQTARGVGAALSQVLDKR